MSNYEATRYDFDGANLTGIEGIPTATIVPWSSSSVPTGFLECNGAAVSRSTYSALFAIISTTYGAGDGASTFNVPNLTDKIAMGKSNNKALTRIIRSMRRFLLSQLQLRVVELLFSIWEWTSSTQPNLLLMDLS